MMDQSLLKLDGVNTIQTGGMGLKVQLTINGRTQ